MHTHIHTCMCICIIFDPYSLNPYTPKPLNRVPDPLSGSLREAGKIVTLRNPRLLVFLTMTS